jgi:flagellar biosynthesis protein FlhF
MKIRRYIAFSMEEAVDRVKRELGRDAVILEVRRIRAPGILGFIKPRRVEVTAAVAQPVVPPASPRLESLLIPATTKAVLSGSLVTRDFLPEDIKTLPKQLQAPYELVCRYKERLVRRGVTPDLAKSIVEQALEAVPPEQMGDANILGSRIHQVIMKLFQSQKVQDQPDRTLAFVGPTGVGKTTTVAKLAAVYSLQQRKKVALITTDTYRIAAVDQLKRYADILHIPLEVVYTPEDLDAALKRHLEVDMVLVDTAGRSPKQGLHLAELKNLLAAVPDIETALVLSATTKAEDLDLIYDHFSIFAPSQVVFTKIDETKSAGALLNLVNRTQLPVTFVTNGQNVPDDLEVAGPEFLTELVLGGALNG